MSDIVERLRAHKADIWNWNGTAMTAWDGWRDAIAKGDKSSWPRDAFESLIGGYGEDMAEAADRIAQLEAALREIETLDDQAECCGVGEYSHIGNPPECCNQPLYGLDRAKKIARAALEERT